ncbi:hypothetical protein [Streptomyces sp. SID8352]|uniref:hypothetical protein n=1 Tax=Streptomyces sp. SID8352 TaxID=2690338 RepID=UPI00136A09E6|nr:hypothetical protein [Streptomyces sp. SID8352]
MAASSAGFVAALTTAALVTVGTLAYRAAAEAPEPPARPRASGPPAPGAVKAPRDRRHPEALPARSGTGERVVYSVDDDRVWLVGADGAARRTFRVTPGTVDPAPGGYAVTSRSNRVIGTDGVPIEHVVRFTAVDGVVIGFSAAVDDEPPEPDLSAPTGGIRESRADGDAMWDFATIGRQVVVIR